MKFLYIAAEHVSGTLSLFQEEHRRRGDECRFITFWHSRWHFPDDICLELPLMPNRQWVVNLRHALTRDVEFKHSHSDSLPYWNPNPVARMLFSLRDRMLWPRISRVIEANALHDFDIIQLDGGLDFTRDGRFARACVARGAKLSAFYHGTDLRQRGIIPSTEDLIGLRLTSEWDLIETDPRLEYLYLPIKTGGTPRREYKFHRPIRVCHAARNRFKGTDVVLDTIARLKNNHDFEFVLLQGLSHDDALARMRDCDIFVDQLTNEGGWGYGMSSVEAMLFGLTVVSNIPQQMATKLGDHPFVQADAATLQDVLEKLFRSESRCRIHSHWGQDWVRQRHDVQRVGDCLYNHYDNLGWLKQRRS